jgi:hypothetical protein
MSDCAECGSVEEPGAGCKECFEGLLAYEFERPVAFGAVHHLTVASYYLQHPRGYSLDALAAWRQVLDDALVAKRPPSEIMKAMSARFEGATRVRDRDAARPAWWPEAWPVTIRDVFNPNGEPPTVEAYVERARAWATSISQTLGEQDPRS